MQVANDTSPIIIDISGGNGSYSFDILTVLLGFVFICSYRVHMNDAALNAMRSELRVCSDLLERDRTMRLEMEFTWPEERDENGVELPMVAGRRYYVLDVEFAFPDINIPVIGYMKCSDVPAVGPVAVIPSRTSRLPFRGGFKYPISALGVIGKRFGFRRIVVRNVQGKRLAELLRRYNSVWREIVDADSIHTVYKRVRDSDPPRMVERAVVFSDFETIPSSVDGESPPSFEALISLVVPPGMPEVVEISDDVDPDDQLLPMIRMVRDARRSRAAVQQTRSSSQSSQVVHVKR